MYTRMFICTRLEILKHYISNLKIFKHAGIKPCTLWSAFKFSLGVLPRTINLSQMQFTITIPKNVHYPENTNCRNGEFHTFINLYRTKK